MSMDPVSSTSSRPLLLIVDDTPSSIDVLAEMLRDSYRVKLARSGPEALEWVGGAEKPDLILLDVMMPGMDGYEVCRRLKDYSATRDIPVLFMTGFDSPDGQVRGFGVGAVDFLVKPLSVEAVRARVALHLRLRQQQEELARYRHHLEDLVAERTSELKTANLKLNETLFAMDRSGIAIHWADADSGRFLYVNDAACSMLGYSRDEYLSMTVADIDPNVPRDSFAQFSAPFRERRFVRLETANRHKDGRLIPVEAILHFREPQPGEAGRFVAFLVDITERRQAQLAAEQARKLLQEAVDSISGGFSVYDRDDRLLLCNEAYRQQYKTSRDLLVPGARFEDIVRVGAERGQYPAAAGDVDAWVSQRAALHRQADGTPVEQQLDDGRWLQVIENRTASGYIVGNRSDITGLKRVTEDLERHRHGLERLVAERTEQLRRLATEATLAEERERQAIARDLHDDLGQMLHVVRIKLDSLMRTVAEEARDPLCEVVALIGEASRMVRSLTSQLSPPVLTELGLVPALGWLAEEMERSYGLRVEIEDDGAPKALSPAQAAILFRAVRELLINVAKHAGVRRARVAARSVAGQLALTVADDGIGIADIEEVLSARHGFGLASVRERVVFLGGSMEIRAAAGDGATVMLNMPLEPPTDRAGEAAA